MDRLISSKRPLDKVVLRAKEHRLDGFERNNEDNFYFVVAADPQLGLIANYGDGTIGDQYPNVTWDKEIGLCKVAVQKLNALRPRPAFCVICGDILDAFPEKWPEIREKQLQDFLQIFSGLDSEIPLICVSGNHDLGNTPTVDTLKQYRAVFGDDYFDFYYKNCQFIVLNSQYYEDHSKLPEEARRQEEWLASVLAEKFPGQRVVFQHIPYFVEKHDEPKNYFNIEPNFRRNKLEQLKKNGVCKIFCGHLHRNAGGYYENMECVVSSAIGCQIGRDTHGMRLVKVLKDGSIEHQYFGLDEFPQKVDMES